MKKNTISTFLFICAALLTVGFAVRLYCDYAISYAYGSAPFYLYVAERLISFMLPAAACLIAGFVVRKKMRSENEE